MPALDALNGHVSSAPQIRGARAASQASQGGARFGAGVFTKAAVTQFWGDTTGVWLPKMPTVRSWPQAFEETFLEFVEDLAFYFGMPLMGHYGMGKLFAKRAGVADFRELGVHTRELEKKLGGALPQKLVAGKVSAALGMLALAGGFEYLIQPVRNMITAKAFGVKNFTAIAGLESARTQVASDERDPMDKGRRRLWQVALVSGALFAGAWALPKAIARSGALEAAARKLLRYADFGGHFGANGKPENLFDITKPLLATIVTAGVISYLDASRDTLERKETALRLGIVAPYLVFGQELIANAVAWFAQRKALPDSPGVRIGDRVAFLGKSLGQTFREALTPEHFLNLNAVRDGKEVLAEVERLRALPKAGLTPAQADTVLRKFYEINRNKYLFSALVMSIGLNLSAYAITRMRFNRRQHENAERSLRQFSASRAAPTFHASLNASPGPSTILQGVAPGGLRRARTFNQAFGAV